jgi:membrane protein implicated in regulation of membrane protease activity
VSKSTALRIAIALLATNYLLSQLVPELSTFMLRLFGFMALPFLVWAGTWPESHSTMGAKGDNLVGFEAKVTHTDPLRVEAHGAIWQARLAEPASPSVGSVVSIVGRTGLTLLVAARGVK